MSFYLHPVLSLSCCTTWCYILLGLILLGILFVLFMVISAAMVKIDIRDIHCEKHPSQASSGRTVTIGFFSDTHGFGCLKSPKWVVGAFQKNKCDLVLFGGDCVHHRTVRPSDRKMLTEASKLLKETNTELYVVFGNHDWQLTESDYEEMGVTLLVDSWKKISANGTEFALCGMSDNERGSRAWRPVPKDFSSYDGFRLLLVHNPDFIYSLPDAEKEGISPLPFDYMLSGHLHGGQVHLPFNLEFVFFRKDRIAREEGILSGEYKFRGYKGFISKGAGNGFLPIRFFARPEIHILKFHI